MISEDSLKNISHIFCGDEGNWYTYKGGPKLVEFFNKYYYSSDKYGQGFPTRWAYVYEKLVNLEGVSLVNGAQTTGTIGSLFLDNPEQVSKR